MGLRKIIRLHSVDCEESAPGLGKPMTLNGIRAKQFATERLKNADEIFLELDICREEPDLEKAIAISQDKYGRVIAHIYIDVGEKLVHFNRELIQLGHSPYFNKYGGSRLYDFWLREAQAIARSEKLGIWSESLQGEYFRDYNYLLPWWSRRAAGVDLARLSSVNGGKKIWACDNECPLITQLLPGTPVCGVNDFALRLQYFKKGFAQKIWSGSSLLRVFYPHKVALENFEAITRLQSERDYGFVEGIIEGYRGIPQLTVNKIFTPSQFEGP